MKTDNSILMNAPLDKIFETASDLSLWPVILPHYRSIHYLKKSPTKNLVQMAARRKWIPVRWTSEQEIDFQKKEIRFHHLKSFTRGMKVVWTFVPVHQGVQVCIHHDLQNKIPLIGKMITEMIIGKFFISFIANQTLLHMKNYVEQNYGK